MKSIHPRKTNYLNNTSHQSQRVKSIWNLLKEMCESTRLQLQLFKRKPIAYLVEIWTCVNIYEWFMTPITKLFWVNKPKGNEKLFFLLWSSDTNINLNPTHHVHHVLKVLFTDKMVINSILLSKVWFPICMTDAEEMDPHMKIRELLKTL